MGTQRAIWLQTGTHHCLPSPSPELQRWHLALVAGFLASILRRYGPMLPICQGPSRPEKGVSQHEQKQFPAL
eukprot:6410389-Alexandrium_andersonii.AAC.1